MKYGIGLIGLEVLSSALEDRNAMFLLVQLHREGGARLPITPRNIQALLKGAREWAEEAAEQGCDIPPSDIHAALEWFKALGAVNGPSGVEAVPLVPSPS